MTGAPVPRVSPGRAPQHGLTRAWTASVSPGERAGFCVPALVGGLLREGAPWLVLGALVPAGVVEGAILGLPRDRDLRQRLDGLSEAGRVVGTASAAAGAWSPGILPGTRHRQGSTWPNLPQALAAASTGALSLAGTGVGQWCELRRHVARVARWKSIAAAGWGAGLIVRSRRSRWAGHPVAEYAAG